MGVSTIGVLPCCVSYCKAVELGYRVKDLPSRLIEK